MLVPMKQELLLFPAVVELGHVGQALEVTEVVSVVVVMWWVFGRSGGGGCLVGRVGSGGGSCFSVVVVC